MVIGLCHADSIPLGGLNSRILKNVVKNQAGMGLRISISALAVIGQGLSPFLQRVVLLSKP
jgi:hypothetical protein